MSGYGCPSAELNQMDWICLPSPVYVPPLSQTDNLLYIAALVRIGTIVAGYSFNPSPEIRNEP